MSGERSSPPPTQGEEEATLSGVTPEIQEQIGRQLQRVYGAVVNEPLPAKLASLLERLATSSGVDDEAKGERRS